MCKCRVMKCWYLNCCKTFTGEGHFCLYCGYLLWNPRNNMMTPGCKCCSLTCFYCRWMGCGWSHLGTASICCAPIEFDDSFAEMKLDELTKQLRAGSIKRDVAHAIVTEQRIYNY